MASTHYYYNPTAGTGNAQITVSARTQNTGATDQVSTVGLTAGTATTSVNLIQKYRPFFVMAGGTTFPETGGTLYFTVNTEYDIAFYSIPSWITVKRNQTTYTNAERISSGVANGSTFGLIAEANSGVPRDDNFMCMGHYIGNTPQSYYQYFQTTQTGSGSYSWTSVTMNVEIGNMPTGFYSVDVTLTSADGNMESTAWTFTSSSKSGTGTIPVKLNGGAAPIEIEIMVTRIGSGTLHYTNNIALDYGTDSLYETGDIGETYVFNTSYQGGYSIDIGIDIEAPL